MQKINSSETKYPLLSLIDDPIDLRKFKISDLPQLCQEIRNFLLYKLSVNTGHLGSNLGAVEMTVAMHYVFDTPNDKIVWDVGHQAYVHKILTGRKKDFDTLRKWGGLSGFPTPTESIYDTFAAGHASNSISAALGMAVALSKANKTNNVIAFLGDGSMTGGMAFEGLNNASSFPNNLLVILNDNNMSIDKNVGGLNKYLVNILTSSTYNRIRSDVYKHLKKLNFIDEKKRSKIQKYNNHIKNFMLQQHNFFDGFCIRYFGPIDGNDVIRAVNILKDIKNFSGPKILHVSTIKGKGYKPAEEDPIIWHAPGIFEVESGLRKSSNNPDIIMPPKFQDVFGKTLVELADIDDRIVGVTPAMPTGCSMSFMMKKYPSRTFDVGIAEEHAVTFSAGLACEGLIPFCNIYSTFMQRAYDQLIHDVALNNIHVIFCLDRAGLVGEDGATHQGAFDIAYMSTIPNMIVCAPFDEVELRNMMYSAYINWKGPISIRYPRGDGYLINWEKPFSLIPIGKGRKLKDGTHLAILSIGTIGNKVSNAINELGKLCESVAHYDLRFAKPLDEELLEEVFSRYSVIITIEEGCIRGGIGSEIAYKSLVYGNNISIKRLGIPDEFIHHGTTAEQFKYCGLDKETIKNEIIESLHNINIK